MAKDAKQVDKEISDSAVKTAVNAVLERYENIESAKGKYMLQARREREGMGTVYEGMAAKGVPQKVMKTEIKIIRNLAKIKGWLSDLEAEERKMVLKLAKAQKDAQQLMLFGDADAPKRPRKGKPTLEVVGAAAEAAAG